jgi:class 3 adenylate cyclase
MMEPVLHNHFGFIDKYIGDAIMALFPRTPVDAVRAALEMLKTLRLFNEKRGGTPLGVSIGINTGSLMLGVVGGTDRLDTTVISDAVNLAARIESLTRAYGVSLLITEHTYAELPKGDEISGCIRKADRVVVKGKSKAVDVYEVFAADTAELCKHKRDSLVEFNAAYEAFHSGNIEEAKTAFQQLLTQCPDDKVVAHYVERCSKRMMETP